MMRVLLVSEGEHELGVAEEESALEILCRRLLERDAEFVRRKVSDPSVRIHLHKGKADGYEKRALRWVRCAEQEGFDALIFVIDQDDDPKRVSQLDLAQNSTLFALPRAIGVAIRTFDAWMLADEKALSLALNQNIPRQREPERIRNPKQTSQQLVVRCSTAETGLRPLYLAVAAGASIDLLEARCVKGFRPFAERVRALA